MFKVLYGMSEIPERWFGSRPSVGFERMTKCRVVVFVELGGAPLHAMSRVCIVPTRTVAYNVCFVMAVYR